LVEVEKNRSIKIEAEAAKVKPFVVVGIPAFNEERTIAKVVLESQRFADKVVVCDDGSIDMTAEIAERLGADVVRHNRNLGYGAAIQSLFKRAKELDADVLITLDGDGQHEPKEIVDILKPLLASDADVVIGSRFVDASRAVMPWYRRAGIRFLTKMANNGSKSDVKDGQSGFRAYSRKAIKRLIMFEDGMGVSVEILVNARKQGLRIQEVSATCNYSRDVKNSTHNPIRHGVSVVMSIVRLVVEERPLLFLGVPGVVSLLVGILFGVWMLQIYALERHIVTNIALASIAFTIIGLFAVFTAITLYAITRLTRKISQQ
jgi:glycosyltransferase involved in cell wall biosynthesis